MGVEVAGIDGVINVALLDHRIARHGALDLLLFDTSSGLPLTNWIDSVVFGFKILDEAIMEVGRRIRPENIPVIFNVGLEHEDAIIDFVQ